MSTFDLGQIDKPDSWKCRNYWNAITLAVRALADERMGSSYAGGWRTPIYRTLREMAAMLNDAGFCTRQGRPFSGQTVKLLLMKTDANPEPLCEDDRRHNQAIYDRLKGECDYCRGGMVGRGCCRCGLDALFFRKLQVTHPRIYPQAVDYRGSPDNLDPGGADRDFERLMGYRPPVDPRLKR